MEHPASLRAHEAEATDAAPELSDDLLRELGFGIDTRAETLQELEAMYGGRMFRYGSYAGTVSDMMACPAFGEELEKGTAAASAWLETHDEPEQLEDEVVTAEEVMGVNQEEASQSAAEEQPQEAIAKEQERPFEYSPRQEPALLFAAKAEPAPLGSSEPAVPYEQAVAVAQESAVAEPVVATQTERGGESEETKDGAAIGAAQEAVVASTKDVQNADELKEARGGEAPLLSDSPVDEQSREREADEIPGIPVVIHDSTHGERSVSIGDVVAAQERDDDMPVLIAPDDETILTSVPIESESEATEEVSLPAVTETSALPQASKTDSTTQPPSVPKPERTVEASENYWQPESLELGGEDEAGDSGEVDEVPWYGETDDAPADDDWSDYDKGLGAQETDGTVMAMPLVVIAEQQPANEVSDVVEQVLASEQESEVEQSDEAEFEHVEDVTQETVRLIDEFTGSTPDAEPETALTVHQKARLATRAVVVLERAKTAKECHEALDALREELTDLLRSLGYTNAEMLSDMVLRRYDIATVKKYLAALYYMTKIANEKDARPKARLLRASPPLRQYGSRAVSMVVNLVTHPQQTAA